MKRLVSLVVMVSALAYPASSTPSSGAFQHSIRPLTTQQQARLKVGQVWHRGCPVSLSQLRLLSVSAIDFDGRSYVGQLVVNGDVARPLVSVFRQLFELRFPIRHMRFAQVYGPARYQPKDYDVSGSFQCRPAVPSPCTGGKSTGTWSNHAYGHEI